MGKGARNIEAVTAELKRQRFKEFVSVEYEYHWKNSSPEIAESGRNIRQMYSWVEVE